MTVLGLQLVSALPAQASSLQPNDHVVTGTIVLNLQVGETVRIVGGGASSNCTRDETNKTVKVTSAPQTETFSFVAKNEGSCFFESSYSHFTVTVMRGDSLVARQAFEVSQPDPLQGYQAFCDNSEALSMDCRKTGDRQVVLTQLTGIGLRGGESALLNFYVHGPGPMIKVQGGGSGHDHSNCTTNETNATVTAGPDPTRIPVGYNVKSDGYCAFEPSYSYFSITISGRDRAGDPVSGTAKIFFGQNSAGDPYLVSCGEHSATVSCQQTGDRELTLSLVPLLVGVR
jgi:hypothetical protein